MQDKTDHSISLVFRIDEDLQSALSAFDPGLICSIGIDPQAEILSITILENNAIQKATSGAQINLTFTTKPRFIYIRGMIQLPQGHYLTAIDRGYFDNHKRIIIQTLNVLKKTFAHLSDLYLICPDRPVDFLLSNGNRWQKFQTNIDTAISLPGGSILASINGQLKVMYFHDVAKFLKSFEETWHPIISNTNLGKVTYISRNQQTPIVTSSDGQIFSIAIQDDRKTTITGHIPRSQVRQMIGPIANHRDVLAAVIDQSSDSVTALLYKMRKRT